MTRDTIKAELETLGVKYNKYASKEALEKALMEAREKPKDAPKEPEATFTASDGVPTQEEAVEKPQETALEPEEEPDYTDEELKNIAESVSGENKPTVEATFAMTGIHKTLGGDTKTTSGIIVPPEVLTRIASTKFAYCMEDLADKSVIHRVSNHRPEYVRTYSRSDHGDNFRELALGFIKKKNT